MQERRGQHCKSFGQNLFSGSFFDPPANFLDRIPKSSCSPWARQATLAGSWCYAKAFASCARTCAAGKEMIMQLVEKAKAKSAEASAPAKEKKKAAKARQLDAQRTCFTRSIG